MEDRRFEMLSAFLDGEAVDAGELAEAFGAPGAREALRDWVRVRAAFADDARPSATFYSRMDRAMAPARPWWRRAVPIPVPALTAAGAIAALLAWGALRTIEAPVGPPTPDRVVPLEVAETNGGAR